MRKLFALIGWRLLRPSRGSDPRLPVFQATLLGPSFVLGVVGIAVLPVAEYAAWALLFAIGSTAIALDGGASQIAQIRTAEGRLGPTELRRLAVLASIAPALSTVLVVVGWRTFVSSFLSGDSSVGPLLAILLGVAALLRSFYSIAINVAVALGRLSSLLRSTIASAATQFSLMILLVRWPTAYCLAGIYLLGTLAGLLLLAIPLRDARQTVQHRQPPRVAARAAVSGLGVAVAQLDRLLAGLVATPAGLAVYDFAARGAAITGALGSSLAMGLTAEGRRSTGDDGRAPPLFLSMVSRTQKNMDRFICVLAPIALVANTILAAVVVPGDLRRAALIGAVLAAGFGATTTTGVGATFLRGAGILRLEFLQNAQRLLLGAALGYGLGARAGIVGFAVGIALANVVSAFWFRRRSLRMLERLLMRGNSSTNSDRIAEGIDRRE